MTGSPDAASPTVGNHHDGAGDTHHQHLDPEPRQYLELTEPSPTDESWGSTLQMPSEEFYADEDATPTSRAPSAAGSHGEDHFHDGYFEPVSGHQPPAPQLTTSSAMASLVEPSASHDAAISHLDLNNLARTHSNTLRPDDPYERPVPHHTISSSSTASAATVRQSDFLHKTTSRPRYLPHFPDQSYSALHSQHHPSSHYPSQVLRARSSNPSSYTSYVAGAKGQRQPAGPTPSKSRTADNSPSGSPGLFTPVTSPSRPKSVHDDASGSYSSPFLHYTQRHVPKETHVADIDVDPISGRKIINQYEIVDELGRGVHGKVKLGRILPEGDYVAIKIVERYSKRKRLGKNTNHEDKIKKEIAILKKARHQNIVSLLEVIDDPQRKKVYIVLEFVELGEIAWRTKGLDEINLIEYRRFLREVSGLDNDTEDVSQQEAQILEDARRKRQKARRHQWKLERNDRLHNRHPENWSFEHQGDEPDDNWDNLSRVSTGTASSVRSHRSATIQEELPPLPVPTAQPTQDISPAPPSDNVDTSDFATITGLPDVVELVKQGSTDQLPDVGNFETLTSTGLEGSMYGSYDDDFIRGRTPSLAGSAGSLILEDPQQMHVPDNFTHVPLMTIMQARNAFRDTVLGLEYLHFQGVIHRDVKPANLLQTKDHRVKISDFGVSYMGRERSSTDPDASESEVPDIDEAVELAKTVGTPAFYAPELCQTSGDEDVPPVTQQIDVWALGVTLYCLIFGRVPFHDHNPFALMAKIAEEQVHIPKRRLKAVEERSASRPSSRGRMFHSTHNHKRSAEDLEYEDVEEDLRDLLRRLFVKDPRQRITLKEVKHHPWVLQGIANPVLWLEETDPARESEAKIQVSREDVQEAVVSLNLIDKITSNLRRGIGNVTGALGLGRSSSTRTRAKSSATNPDGHQPPSTASSSSTISQDARRASLRPEESIPWALRASKEPEHPLAQSQTASPELKDPHYQYFPSFQPPPKPLSEASDADVESDRSVPSRPLPGRAVSTNSAEDSAQTIRQKNVKRSILKETGTGVSTYPALPSTPQALEPPDSASFGGILGNAGRRLTRLVARSRDRHGSRERSLSSRTSSTRRSVDVSSESHDDMHAEPSLGLSHTIASGTMKQPNLPGSRPRSSTSSAAVSTHSPHDAHMASPEGWRKSAFGISRHSSVSSTSSARRRPATASREANEHVNQYYAQPPPEPDFDRAREESFRRRIAEEHQSQDRASRPSSSLNEPDQASQDCPPSPDDLLFYRRQRDDAVARLRYPNIAVEPQPIPNNISQLPPPGHFMTPSSSDDHFTGLSQSTSNPSIPSVMSADSSVSPDFEEQSTPDASSGRTDKDGNATDPPSDSSTVHRQPISHRQRSGHEDDEGYAGDHAVESGDEDADDDSDSDDDNFLEMGSRKARRKPSSATRGSVSIAELPGRQQQRLRTSMMAQQKTARSGSSNTMHKIASHSSDEEGTMRPSTTG